MNWLNPLSIVAEKVGGFFQSREKRKSLEKQIDGKIALAKETGEKQVVFNEQEIDAINKRNEGETWKDEYITVIMTLPIVVTFLSVFIGVVFNWPEVIAASSKANDSIKDLVPNYQELLGLTIVAGLGLRAYRKK